MLSTKNLVFKEISIKKLTERYVGPYEIEEVVSNNVVELKLPVSIRIHPVVNVSRVMRYREPVKRQRIEEPKPVEVEGVEEWEVEKILHKRKVQGVEKYLVYWKEFMVENNTWKREGDLENARELVEEFERRLSVEVRRQEGVEERWKVKMNPETDEFRRSELPGKYMAKILFGWDDKKFEDKYLRKLERCWQRWKLVSPEEKP